MVMSITIECSKAKSEQCEPGPRSAVGGVLRWVLCLFLKIHIMTYHSLDAQDNARVPSH